MDFKYFYLWWTIKTMPESENMGQNRGRPCKMISNCWGPPFKGRIKLKTPKKEKIIFLLDYPTLVLTASGFLALLFPLLLWRLKSFVELQKVVTYYILCCSAFFLIYIMHMFKKAKFWGNQRSMKFRLRSFIWTSREAL